MGRNGCGEVGHRVGHGWPIRGNKGSWGKLAIAYRIKKISLMTNAVRKIKSQSARNAAVRLNTYMLTSGRGWGVPVALWLLLMIVIVGHGRLKQHGELAEDNGVKRLSVMLPAVLAHWRLLLLGDKATIKALRRFTDECLHAKRHMGIFACNNNYMLYRQ